MIPNDDRNTSSVEAPYPGSRAIPRWSLAQLPDVPRFTWRNWAGMLGPGLVMGAAAIGGGEWLVGPVITARYGGGLLWLAALSILGQVVYNIEISRYTLYTGEPIFTGKFRTLPGPMFWVWVYILLDFGMIFPYLPASAAVPLLALWRGTIPDPVADQVLLQVLAIGIFLLALIPLVIGGKIYNFLKVLMTVKLVVVLGFLTVVAVLFSHAGTWKELCSGFFKVGNVPIRRIEDQNRNGTLDLGEDWDSDGHLDVLEPSLALSIDSDGDGTNDATDINNDRRADNMVSVWRDDKEMRWPDLDNDGQPDSTVRFDSDGDHKPDQTGALDQDQDGILDKFIDLDGDGTRDGDNLDNIFLALLQGRSLPVVDLSIVGFLAALVAISGGGGLGNTPISNYTREQGWGMGSHVGAIPSIIGGRKLQLSHVGTVFLITEEALQRWRKWYRHVARDQLGVWLPACLFGVAMPSMLSIEFLKRGASMDNQWLASVMTAEGLRERAGQPWGNFFWFMTIFCGFLVLGPTLSVAIDAFVRRWVDVFWTASSRLRQMDPQSIRYVYFGVLAVYTVASLIMLLQHPPLALLRIAAVFLNFAMGFSCWHTLWINIVLLPRHLRPNWFVRIALFFAGLFFCVVGVIATLNSFQMI